MLPRQLCTGFLTIPAIVEVDDAIVAMVNANIREIVPECVERDIAYVDKLNELEQWKVPGVH